MVGGSVNNLSTKSDHAQAPSAPLGTIVDVRLKDLSTPQALATGGGYTLRLDLPTLHVRLPIDPARDRDAGERYILQVHGPDGARRAVRTVKADQVAKDKHVDLLFHLYEPEATFTLFTRLPGQRPYKLFDGLKFDQLFR